MTGHDFAIMALVLGAASLAAAILGRRTGNDRRDVRLMIGIGAAFSGLALVLSPLSWT